MYACMSRCSLFAYFMYTGETGEEQKSSDDRFDIDIDKNEEADYF